MVPNNEIDAMLIEVEKNLSTPNTNTLSYALRVNFQWIRDGNARNPISWSTTQLISRMLISLEVSFRVCKAG